MCIQYYISFVVSKTFAYILSIYLSFVSCLYCFAIFVTKRGRMKLLLRMERIYRGEIFHLGEGRILLIFCLILGETK